MANQAQLESAVRSGAPVVSAQRIRRAKRISKREQTRRLKLTILAIGIVMLLFLGGIGLQTASLYKEQAHYASEISKLTQEIADQDALTKELEMRKLQVTSDEYIKAEARTKLNMVYGNEILIKKKN